MVGSLLWGTAENQKDPCSPMHTLIIKFHQSTPRNNYYTVDSCCTYLVVLIRSYRDEGRLMKDMSTVGSVLGSKGIVFICFDYV